MVCNRYPLVSFLSNKQENQLTEFNRQKKYSLDNVNASLIIHRRRRSKTNEKPVGENIKLIFQWCTQRAREKRPGSHNRSVFCFAFSACVDRLDRTREWMDGCVYLFSFLFVFFRPMNLLELTFSIRMNFDFSRRNSREISRWWNDEIYSKNKSVRSLVVSPNLYLLDFTRRSSSRDFSFICTLERERRIFNWWKSIINISKVYFNWLNNFHN